MINQRIKKNQKKSDKEKEPKTDYDYFNDLQNKLSTKPLTDADVLKLTSEIEPELERTLGLDVREYLSISKVTVDLIVEEDLIEIFVDDISSVTEIDKALESGKGDIFIVGSYELVGEKDILIKVKGYDKDKKKFILEFEIKTSIDKLSRGALDESKRIALNIIAKITNMPAGKLVVQTDTPEAIVYFDDKFIGQTSALDSTEKKAQLVVEYIPYGYHKLEIIKKGYKKAKNTIYIKENKINLVEHRLYKIKEEGIIEINSDPIGADVYLDLEFKGVTPVKVENLPPGVHRVRVQMEGYNDRNIPVRLDQVKKQKIDVVLEKEEDDYFIPELRSKEYRRLRALFVYSTIAFLPVTLASYYMYDYEQDKKIQFERNNNITYDDEAIFARIKDFNTGQKKLRRTERVKDIITTINGLSLVLSLTFLWLELDAEDIEIGLGTAPEQYPGAGGNLFFVMRY